MTVWKIWASIFIGIAAISSASILIRITDAPPLTIAMYRMAISSLFLTVPGVLCLWKFRAELKYIYLTIFSGISLAAHFGFWITSLSYTTVASSVSLVNTSPIFVALISTKLLKEKPTSLFWLGVILAFSGSVALTKADFSISGTNALGDVLAICGALALSGYLLIGRYVLRQIPFTAYVFVAYGVGAICMLLLCITFNIKLTGFTMDTTIKFFLIAIIPQFIGHSIFNWSLKFLPASTVSLLILGEPIGASFLAYFLLGETIPPKQALSLVLIGSGILLGSLSISKPREVN